MEEVEQETELSEKNLINNHDSISPSFSYDGYEILHDEAMDKISVNIHYGDCEEAFNANSCESTVKNIETSEKKMKISLSQEQLKLKNEPKNFLNVPMSTRKSRIKLETVPDSQILRMIESKAETSGAFSVNRIITLTPTKIQAHEDLKDVVYAVPRCRPKKEENEIEISSGALPPLKSVATAQTSSSTSELNKSFKYPLSFYCKICNNILSDPRTLDCLHSFCIQCLAKLDASNNLQNNQFWRQISEHSDSSCKFSCKIIQWRSDNCLYLQFKHRRDPAWSRKVLIRQSSRSPEALKAGNFTRTKQVSELALNGD